MNSKLISYEDVKRELARLEKTQIRLKKLRKKPSVLYSKSNAQSSLVAGVGRINELLTIIHLYKQSRKLYGLLQEALREKK